jgi:hypothetical protein
MMQTDKNEHFYRKNERQKKVFCDFCSFSCCCNKKFNLLVVLLSETDSLKLSLSFSPWEPKITFFANKGIEVDVRKEEKEREREREEKEKGEREKRER